MKTLLQFTATIFFTFLAFSNIYAQNIEQISPIRAKLMARNGALMIDVRETDEVKALAYDVDGIVNIPLSEFKDRLNEIPQDRAIIVACRSGNRSSQAAKILHQNGYSDISNMEGGMMAWQAKKLEVITDGLSSKKACCSDPNSKNCNPDGTCKKPSKRKRNKKNK